MKHFLMKEERAWTRIKFLWIIDHAPQNTNNIQLAQLRQLEFLKGKRRLRPGCEKAHLSIVCAIAPSFLIAFLFISPIIPMQERENSFSLEG